MAASTRATSRSPQRPVGAPGRLDVAVVEVDAGALGDADDLLGGLDHPVALRPDVDEEPTALGGDDRAQGDELLGVGVGGGDVDEPGGQAQGAARPWLRPRPPASPAARRPSAPDRPSPSRAGGRSSGRPGRPRACRRAQAELGHVPRERPPRPATAVRGTRRGRRCTRRSPRCRRRPPARRRCRPVRTPGRCSPAGASARRPTGRPRPTGAPRCRGPNGSAYR